MPLAARSAQSTNSPDVVAPPISHPSAPNAALRTATNAQALRRLNAAGPRGTRSRFSGVVLGEAARRPVGLGRVAAARAVQRCDVLQRDEDVAVELDVGDVLDRAVRRQRALLILAAEECDLDLLALVLVRVVLHEAVSLLPRDCRPERRFGRSRSWR